MKIVRCFVTALVLGLAWVVGTISAQPQQAPAVTTVITVPTMDCGHCANKIGKQLVTVPGVQQVNPYVDNRQLVVVPLPNAGVSPQLLWDAVVRAGFAPTRMDSPYGSFNARPQK